MMNRQREEGGEKREERGAEISSRKTQTDDKLTFLSL